MPLLLKLLRLLTPLRPKLLRLLKLLRLPSNPSRIAGPGVSRETDQETGGNLRVAAGFLLDSPRQPRVAAIRNSTLPCGPVIGLVAMP